MTRLTPEELAVLREMERRMVADEMSSWFATTVIWSAIAVCAGVLGVVICIAVQR